MPGVPKPWRRAVTGRRMEIRPGRFVDVALHRAPGEFGAPEGRLTVFLVHGAGGNKDQWRAQWRTLAAQGHDLVAVDLIGHGESPRPREPSLYAGAELIADLMALFDRHRGARNVLVGHSYGSGLVLRMLLALRDAGRADAVAAAVLIGTGVFRGEHPIRAIPLATLRANRPALDADFRARAWHPSADRALVDHEMRLASRNSLAAYKALFEAPDWADPARIPELDLPVLVLAGADDAITPPEGARALAALLPRATLDVVPRACHLPMLEQPEHVDAALLRFLATVAPARADDSPPRSDDPGPRTRTA